MFAVVHLPDFALQTVLRHEPEVRGKPVVLVDAAATTPRVLAATAAARRDGVTDGLTAPQALARCASVLVRHRSVAAEARATDGLLQCAYAFSPNLEVTGPGLLTLDLRGLVELAPRAGETSMPAAAEARERAWASRLARALNELGWRVTIGLAHTPNVARHAALAVGHPERAATDEAAAGIRRIPAERAAGFVGALPVSALEPSSDVADRLQRWGIRTVAELLALGQDALAERLGLEALALFAAASVTTGRPLRLATPPERYEESHAFEMGVETIEPLLFLLRRFCEALARRVQSGGWAAGQLRLRLALDDREPLETTLRLPEPSSEPDVWFRVLHTHLETLRADAPVLEVALAIDPARPTRKQFELFEAALRDPHQFHETLARLAAIVGPDRVGTPIREDSHRADAFQMRVPDFENAPRARSAEAVPELLRPTAWRRLRPGESARVDAADTSPARRPLFVRAPTAHGKVTDARGPWRSSGHWWTERGWDRDEWEVAVASGWVLRLVRVAEGWRVEAVLD